MLLSLDTSLTNPAGLPELPDATILGNLSLDLKFRFY